MTQDEINGVKKEMVDQGHVDSIGDLDWLTVEYTEQCEREDVEVKDAADADGVALRRVDYGNQWYHGRDGYWHWKQGENKPGGNLACGTKHSRKRKPNRGDSAQRKTKCSTGHYWYELKY